MESVVHRHLYTVSTGPGPEPLLPVVPDLSRPAPPDSSLVLSCLSPDSQLADDEVICRLPAASIPEEVSFHLRPHSRHTVPTEEDQFSFPSSPHIPFSRTSLGPSLSRSKNAALDQSSVDINAHSLLISRGYSPVRIPIRPTSLGENPHRPVPHFTSTKMSSATNSQLPQDTPSHPSPQDHLPSSSSSPSQASQPRRPRPSQVQTRNLVHALIPNGPTSAITSSSMTSSPESGVPTTNTSVHASPDLSSESLRGRISEASTLPAVEGLQDTLPGPIISHKTSTNSLPHSVTSERSSTQTDAPNKAGIFRRISVRMKHEGSRIIGGRRTSSTHPASRDTSVGPAVMRRGRSDSSATAPPEYAIVGGSDSDDDTALVREQSITHHVPIAEGEALRDFSPTVAPSIAATSTLSDIHIGPVIPTILEQGTSISKVSTKRRKRLNLILDSDAGKIIWDKSRPSKCVYIDDIKEIRVSPDVRQYRLDCGVAESEEHRFFSILYAVPGKKDHKTMHLIAENKEDYEAWTETLDALSKHRQELMTSLMTFNDRAIQIYWSKEMSRLYPENPPADEELDFAGVERVCRNLHIHVSPETLRAKFDLADRTQSGKLNFNEFQGFVRLLAQRDDVRAIYNEISSGHEDGLSFQDFITFLRDVQNEDVSDIAAKEMIFRDFVRKTARPGAEDGASDEPRMSEVALARYLSSVHNVPVAAVPQNCELDRPVNEYYISSSHNTYLTGRQVADVSSIEGYISALMRGCRCIEVDCWDGPDGQPVVTHGKTLTTQIQFREVIAAINKYAFIKSQYPLWVSLEVHCNAKQQETMAAIMKEIFREKLVTERLDDSTTQLPSPEQLKGRILVKCKSPNLNGPKATSTEATGGRKRGNSLTSPFSHPVMSSDASIPNSPLLSPNPPAPRRGSNRRVNTINEGEISDAQDILSSSSSDDSGPERTRRSKQSKITQDLGDLGVYCLGIKFRGFDDSDCKIFNHILSFKERTFLNNSSTKVSKDALFRHNMRYLMRVYPGQHRLTSTNFDPLIYWRRGVQMAALNWQTFDLGMQFNQAMFAGGKDGSGYVLKPRAFREIQMVSTELATKRERKKVSFTIDVISAQQLMRPVNLGERRTVDPYVEVEVFLADDKRDKQDAHGQPLRGPLKHRTQVIRENGFNPVFDKKFSFDVRTKYPDLVFVRWSVKLSDGGNHNDRTPAVATYTAKLTSLKQGYRTLPLLDHNGDRYLFSTLFCRVKVEPITSVFVNYDGEGDNSNKLKSLSRTVFNRKEQSPKASMDKDSITSSQNASQYSI